MLATHVTRLAEFAALGGDERSFLLEAVIKHEYAPFPLFM